LAPCASKWFILDQERAAAARRAGRVEARRGCAQSRSSSLRFSISGFWTRSAGRRPPIPAVEQRPAISENTCGMTADTYIYPAEDDATFHRWVDDTRADIKPHLRSNSYVNLSTDDGPAWRRGVWGSPAKYAQLVRTKTACDPRNLFRYNKNIPPAA
jgi:Berberine and berberine like